MAQRVCIAMGLSRANTRISWCWIRSTNTSPSRAQVRTSGYIYNTLRIRLWTGSLRQFAFELRLCCLTFFCQWIACPPNLQMDSTFSPTTMTILQCNAFTLTQGTMRATEWISRLSSRTPPSVRWRAYSVIQPVPANRCASLWWRQDPRRSPRDSTSWHSIARWSRPVSTCRLILDSTSPSRDANVWLEPVRDWWAEKRVLSLRWYEICTMICWGVCLIRMGWGCGVVCCGVVYSEYYWYYDLCSHWTRCIALN